MAARPWRQIRRNSRNMFPLLRRAPGYGRQPVPIVRTERPTGDPLCRKGCTWDSATTQYRAATGLFTSPLWRITLSPSMVASAGTNFLSSPAT